jgi:hypothetical protein
VCGGKRRERSDNKVCWNGTRGKQDDQTNINSFGKRGKLLSKCLIKAPSCDAQTPPPDELYRPLSLPIPCGSRSASFSCLHSTPLIWEIAIYYDFSSLQPFPCESSWGLRLRLRQVRSNRENPAELSAGVHPGLQQTWIYIMIDLQLSSLLQLLPSLTSMGVKILRMASFII